MIRLIQRRLIIPRGDTGSFSIPVLANKNTGDVAVFTIFNEMTKTRMFQKIVTVEGDVINIAFSHNDTVNLKPGQYFWDVKFYSNPQFVDEELVNGDEVDSYYAGFTMPKCEIRETADNYLVSPDSPTATLSPEQLDIITGAIASLNEAIEKTNSNVEHYPIIRDEVWYRWDTEENDYVSTGVRANGIVGNGIESAVLNNDYTLTLNFTDGTSFTSSSIRGATGNGIDDINLNNDFTLTITYTDGNSYTTPPIRGERGPIGYTYTPNVAADGTLSWTNNGSLPNPASVNITGPRGLPGPSGSEYTVLVQDTQPTESANKLWINNQYTNIQQVPTVEEMNTGLQEIEDLLSKTMIMKTPIKKNTDLNNVIDTGAYLLFNGYTYTHAPSFYSSGQAWVFVYDALTTDGYSFRMQIFIKSSNKLVASRTYTTSGGSGSWGDWTEYTMDDTLSQSGKAADASAVGTALAKTMHAQAAINENTDLDNITDMGFYLLFSGRTYTHAPAFYSSGSAWLFVYDTVASGVNFRIQFFMKSSNKLFAARTYTTSGGVGSWGDWVIYSDAYRALFGKKISLVGDSISTYKNYVPSNYAWYYPQPSPADVDSVNKTWWKQIIDKSGMTLLKNASWSGSRVSWIPGTTGDEMAKVAYTDARIGDLADGDTKPDIVIVLIGTNDFANSIALGTLDANTELPAVSGEITDFRPAYAAMINNIRTTYPHAHVYCCTLIQRFYSTDETYPIKNADGNALALYNRAIMDVAEWMGCEVIRLDTAVSLGEVADYTIDGRIHPNAAGMIKIADKVLQTLVQCETTY